MDHDLSGLVEAAKENLYNVQRQNLRPSNGFIKWKGGEFG